MSELYTTWSRAIYIDPYIDLSKAFSMSIVKLPELNHVDTFLEPMTLWRLNSSGENKDRFTPKKHPLNQNMWRSFGNIVLPYSAENENKCPGIISWFKFISQKYNRLKITINAVSMQDDGNATSWVPIDEIFDSMNISEILITDDSYDGWVFRITNAIEDTKTAISNTFRRFMFDVKEIRNIESMSLVNRNVEDLYNKIDMPFREWISSINSDDSKDDKVFQWRKKLMSIIDEKAKSVLAEAGNRDFIGIKKGDRMFNIVDAYTKFKYFLNENL